MNAWLKYKKDPDCFIHLNQVRFVKISDTQKNDCNSKYNTHIHHKLETSQ